MKRLLILLLLAYSFQNFAQELQTEKTTDTITSSIKEQKKGRQLLFNTVSRVYATIPCQFGDHALADAHHSKVGFGTTFSLLEYKNFRLTWGHEIGYYSSENISKTGKFSSTRVYSSFGVIS